MSEYDGGGIELQDTDGYDGYQSHDGYQGYEGQEGWPGLGLELPTFSELGLGDHGFGTHGFGTHGFGTHGYGEPGWDGGPWDPADHEPGLEDSEHGSGWEDSSDLPAAADLGGDDSAPAQPAEVPGADPVIVS